MKLERKQIVNALILIGLLLFIFTPIGFRVKVFASRLLASSAAIIKEEMQMPLDTYQWELVNVNGNPFDFENEKGEVIFVNFWATWCPPCVAEMPSIQELYNDYGDKVTFVMVAQDDVEKVKNFLTKKEYNFPVYFSRSKAPDVLDSKVIPTTYVINKEGHIIIAETGAADWNSSKIRLLLDGLLK
ncbi:MAG: thiol-disulfide oxidoreductase [Flavobacteriaceae bacterium]|nr:MAG: thiol-disulfide oxidoreductase [Flavobacteriaceae bacterium]